MVNAQGYAGTRLKNCIKRNYKDRLGPTVPSLLQRLPVKLVNRGRYTRPVYLFSGSTPFHPFHDCNSLCAMRTPSRTSILSNVAHKCLAHMHVLWLSDRCCIAVADSNYAICVRLYFLQHMALIHKSLHDIYIPVYPRVLKKPFTFGSGTPSFPSYPHARKPGPQSLISCENEFSIFLSLFFSVSYLSSLICLVVLGTDSIDEQGDCTSWAGIPSSFPRRYERNKSCRLSQQPLLGRY